MKCGLVYEGMQMEKDSDQGDQGCFCLICIGDVWVSLFLPVSRAVACVLIYIDCSSTFKLVVKLGAQKTILVPFVLRLWSQGSVFGKYITYCELFTEH